MGLLSTTPEWKQAMADWRGIQDAPAEQNRSRLDGIKVLENDFLEKYFATAHWIVPAVWVVPTAGYLLYAAGANHGLGWVALVVCFGLGLLGWTLVEYVLHRFLFHLPVTEVRPFRDILFAMHGYHHEFPNDPDRLVAPPVIAWPLAVLVGAVYWLCFGAYWQALLAGTFVGYLGYDWMHYYTHHAVPRSRFGKFMRQFHFEHHFKCSNVQFGLSQPLWDYVFWTHRPKKAPARAS